MNSAETLNPATASLPKAGQGATESRPTAAAPLKPGWIMLLAVLAVATFHLGFLFAPVCWLVLVWLGCLFALRRVPSGRWAFYTGLAIGLGIYGPQLYFFWDIFGPAAIALWLVLAFWLALFVLLLHGVEKCWGTTWAVVLAPVLWLGIEFFRSELYYLRFAWFTAGSLVPLRATGGLLPWFGVYGFGALLVWIASTFARMAERRDKTWRMDLSLMLQVVITIAVLTVLVFLWIGQHYRETAAAGLQVTGIQMEFPSVLEVTDRLRKLWVSQPQAQLVALSEYTFDGPVPDEVRAWCRDNRRWLVAGGKEPLAGGKFYNTAYVVGTNGAIVFKQAKAVPIQFFNDGVPAPEQRVWESPWGKIGICICYDLSYARVVDRLISQGAQALLVPAMDTQMWGAHEHELNARMTPVRAAEYGVPIFRVSSSGISQVVDRHGRVRAQLPFPGQGEIIQGRLVWPNSAHGRLPLDRYLAPVAVLATVVIMILLGWQQYRTYHQAPLPSNS